MGGKLVIVESPAKAKTINKILGKEFVVMSSMGHVRDLPAKKFGVDIKNDFKPVYVQVDGKKDLVKRLQKEAADSDAIYLAPDPDREGEAIAWHLECLLKKGLKDTPFHRVTYNEVTPHGVKEAFRNPRVIDMNRVNAQQARRVVDRIVGYKVSPLLWGRVKGAISAGRVQSVALRLLCEREAQIIGFKPEEYWVLGAKVRKLIDPRDPFEIRLIRVNGEKTVIKDEPGARALLKDLEGCNLVVAKVVSRDISKKPYPPFITSSLQQAMSARFGVSPSQTMRIAQKLYEGVELGGETAGLITYMRTDSFNIAAEALKSCRDYISAGFDKAYLPDQPNYYRSRSGAQGAHEAIRPTDVSRTPASVAQYLAPAELKVYRAIWERFVASQMTPAVMRQTTVDIAAKPVMPDASSCMFRAGSSHVLFDGFMKVFGVVRETEPKKEKEDEGESLLKAPPLSEGENLECLEWLSNRKETKPPDRYTEGSLVKELERNGVGRPSTYAQIIQTLQDRRYVTRNQRTLFPSPLGMNVNAFLVASLSDLFDVGFTSKMEEELDSVEEGRIDWVAMMREFYTRFDAWIQGAKGPSADEGVVRSILELLEGVGEWGPEVRSGKRIRGDRPFVESIKKQMEKKTRAISQRQLDALGRIAWKYEAQVPGLKQALEAAVIAQPSAEETMPPSEATRRKLDAFAGVTFTEPVTKRGRTYDDGKLIASFRGRVDGGRELSEAQLHLLDRILLKYGEQIKDFDRMKQELGISESSGNAPDTESEGILALLRNVQTWKEPVERRGKKFSDSVFYESLSRQFEQRKSLSPRQKAVLKRMAVSYKDQIQGFEEAAAKFGLKAGRGRKNTGQAEADGDDSGTRSE